MAASVAKPQSPFRSVQSLGSFESGGSCGSRSRAVTSGGLHSELSDSFHSNGSVITDGRSSFPAGVAVTVLQPAMPEDDGQPLIGTLSDQMDQMVKITSWPVLRLPFRVHPGTILTLRLFKAAPTQSPFSSAAEIFEQDSFVAGIRVPVGKLMAQESAVQCWCALDDRLSATATNGAAVLEAFKFQQKRATYEICPKAFIALRPIRADQLSTSPSSALSPSLVAPMTPVAPRRRAPQAGSPLSSELDRLLAIAAEEEGLMVGGQSPRRSPGGVGRTESPLRTQERELWILKAELQNERSRREASTRTVNESMSELYHMLATENVVVQKLQTDMQRRSDFKEVGSSLLASEDDGIRTQDFSSPEALPWAFPTDGSVELSNNVESMDAPPCSVTELISEVHEARAAMERSDKAAERAEKLAAHWQGTLEQQQEHQKVRVTTMNETRMEAREARLQALSQEVVFLKAALQQQEGRTEDEARAARAETAAADAQREEAMLMVEQLRNSEDLLLNVESRLDHGLVPEAQSLVDALLEQEQNNEHWCREFSELNEIEAAGGRNQEEVDGVRGQLIRSIESRLQILQDECSKEREHYNFHDGHASSIAAQFEELRDYSESKDKLFSMNVAELKVFKQELQAQREGGFNPEFQALRSELDMLEQCCGQERCLREKCEKELQDARAELQAEVIASSKLREDRREQASRQPIGLEIIEVPGLTSSTAVSSQLEASNSGRPALRTSKAGGDTHVVDSSGRRRESLGRQVSFDDAPAAPSGTKAIEGNADTDGVQDAGSTRAAGPPAVTVTSGTDAGLALRPARSAAAKAEPEAPGILHVKIDRSQDSIPLGIDLNRDKLEIDSISAGGLLSTWNSAHPSKAVHVGDRILDVNGAQTAHEIITECQELKVLHMTVARKVGSATVRDSGSRRGTGHLEPPAEPSRQKARTESSASALARSASATEGGDRKERLQRERGDLAGQKNRSKSEALLREEKRGQGGQRPSGRTGSPYDSPSSSIGGPNVGERLPFSFSGASPPAKDEPSTRKTPSRQAGSVEKKSNANFLGSLRG